MHSVRVGQTLPPVIGCEKCVSFGPSDPKLSEIYLIHAPWDACTLLWLLHRKSGWHPLAKKVSVSAHWALSKVIAHGASP